MNEPMDVHTTISGILKKTYNSQTGYGAVTSLFKYDFKVDLWLFVCDYHQIMISP